MKTMLIMALVLSGAALAGTAGAADIASVGPGEGIVVPGPDTNPCPGSQRTCNDDGSFENGYAWQYGGIVPPYYGAFAEGYDTGYIVCGIQLKLTDVGYWQNQPLDAYVWDSDGSNPSNVLGVTTNLHVTPPAMWPNISTHDLDISDVSVSGGYFVGYWGNWPGMLTGWYVAADLDGFGGLPRTNIAPGIGYPTGWQDPSVVWGPTQALGICAYTDPGIVPTRDQTWGQVKNTFR